MALEVQEADGDLVQRGSMLEPQVMLPQLSYRHPKEWGSLGLQQPSPCPWGRGSLEPNMVLPGKGASVCHLLGSSQGWDKLRLPRAARGSGTQRRVGPSLQSCNPFNSSAAQEASVQSRSSPGSAASCLARPPVPLLGQKAHGTIHWS